MPRPGLHPGYKSARQPLEQRLIRIGPALEPIRRAQRALYRPSQLGSVLVAIHCALLKGVQFQQLFLIIIHYSTLPHEPFNDETRCMPIRLERRDEGNMTKSRGQVKWPSTLTRTGRCLRRRGFSRDDRHAKLAT